MSAKEKDPNKLKLDKHIGIKLRNKRVERKLNQTKVADVLGVTFQQVQKYERGINRISAGRLFQFSRILDVPVGYFYDKIGDEGNAPAYGGLSDNKQEAFGGKDDIMQSKETIDLVRAYYSIEDQAKRKETLRFIKAMTGSSSDS